MVIQVTKRRCCKLVDTPIYRAYAHYSVDDKGDAVEVWRTISEEFTPIHADGAGCSATGEWEKILRRKKDNRVGVDVDRVIRTDSWRLQHSTRTLLGGR